MACLPKLCPRTKHINVCYHHFCEHVHKGLIKILPIHTENQIANALTKLQAQTSFCQHRWYMCGRWRIIAVPIVRECCDINNLPPQPQLTCFCKLQHRSKDLVTMRTGVLINLCLFHQSFSFMWLISKNWRTWEWPVRKWLTSEKLWDLFLLALLAFYILFLIISKETILE